MITSHSHLLFSKKKYIQAMKSLNSSSGYQLPEDEYSTEDLQ